MTTVTIGIDLAKNVFAVHGVDATGKPVLVRPGVRGCKNFCVNGQMAGNCCTSNEMKKNDRYERIDRQPAG